MNLTHEFELIRKWAWDKNILAKGDLKTQTIKLQEEVGELAAGVMRGDQEAITDAIGDIVVVLTSLAYFNNATIEDCINAAYKIIKDRTGQMKDGNFIKSNES